ncbi:MAG TPA: arsenate reductase ArsC [Pyrinomonadaceae bacterium]|jgi:arsenate reductase|nr:arsenate reductase ArsC [Pyrinomonadaceae bacterium]
MMNKKRILIMCTGNSARSQMGEGLLRYLAGDRFEVESAGFKPSRVRPEATKVMREIGIDISGQRSKSVDEFAGQEFDYVITVCDSARETCPIFPGKAIRIHHTFEDPPPEVIGDEASRLAIFRRVRNEIKEWLEKFLKENETRSSAGE